MITWITSANKSLYNNKIYAKCLNSWDKLSGNKILFSEDNFSIKGFNKIDLQPLVLKNNPSPVGSKRTFFRFYYKALSIYTALTQIKDSQFIIWLDSDIEIFKSIDQEMINTNCAISSIFYNFSDKFIKDNDIKHSFGADTGIIIFNMDKLSDKFAKEYIDYWHCGYIKNLYRAKDAWVFCDLVNKKYKQDSYNLINGNVNQQSLKNYLEYTNFNDYLYHYIGKGQKHD